LHKGDVVKDDDDDNNNNEDDDHDKNDNDDDCQKVNTYSMMLIFDYLYALFIFKYNYYICF